MATQQNQWNVGPVDTVDPSPADEDPNGLDTLIQKIQTSTHRRTLPFKHVAATLSGFKDNDYRQITRAKKHELTSVHNALQEVLTAFESRLLITIANKHRPDDNVISACDRLLKKFLDDKDKSDGSMFQTYLTAARTRELNKLRASVEKLQCHSSYYDLQFTNNIPITTFIRCLNSIERERSDEYPEIKDLVGPIRSQFHRIFCKSLFQKASETAYKATHDEKYEQRLDHSGTTSDCRVIINDFLQEIASGNHHRMLACDASEDQLLKTIKNWDSGNYNSDVTFGQIIRSLIETLDTIQSLKPDLLGQNISDASDKVDENVSTTG
ncbi:hypothetical protein V866_007856 [Kwoniella sp. B9012]